MPPEAVKIRDFFVSNKMMWLLALVPVTLVIRYLHLAGDTLIFILAALSMVPLARWLSEATEHLAARTGPSIGALLNVTFGNAGELMIGFFALRQGLQPVVKASIAGSILMNLLLTLGVSMIAGGIRRKTLSFNALQARTRATMLTLAAIGLICPAAFVFLGGSTAARREGDLSLEFSIILLITYGCGLFFTLRTHHDLLTGGQSAEPGHPTTWTATSSLVMLASSAAAIGWMSEVLVGSIEVAAHTLGMTDLFAGLIVVALAGNAAEATSAIRAAMQNRMDLCVGIATGSSLQIALFVAPALVILSQWTGPHPMNLVFTSAELLSLVLAIAINGQIAGDGDSNWLEGVQLCAVYLMLAVMFYLLPGSR